MLYYDFRFLEGSPLHYYYPPSPPQQLNLSFLSRFPSYDYLENREDSTMSLPPTSPQSDSDNSVSSVEISYKELNGIRPVNPKSDCKCSWINCGLSFESLDLLANHVSRVHAASGPGGLFYCRWEGCTRNNKGFNARYKMLVHVRTHTNEKPHKCCQCNKSFSRAENLKIHIRSHSGEKPYVCPVPGCNKAYSNSSDRFKHTRTHQVEKPYHCKVPGCPKRYTDPSSLRKHVKTYKHFIGANSSEEAKTTLTNNILNNDVYMNQLPNTKVIIGENREQREPESNQLNEYNSTEMRDSNEKECKNECKSDYYISEGIESIPKCNAYEELLYIRDHTFKPVTWNVFDSYMSSEKKIYRPYDLHHEEMDIDLPLDLSIGARE